LSTISSESDDTERRADLGERFFEDPGILDEIRKDYRITHILVNEEDYARLNLESDDRLDMKSENDGYVLLEIMGEDNHLRNLMRNMPN